MQNLNIQELTAAMDATIQHHGVDDCEAHANAVYSGVYRSEPIRICDHLNSLGLDQEGYYEAFNQIESDVRGAASEAAYFKATGIDVNQRGYGSDDGTYYEFENWIYDEGYQPPVIKENAEICFLCNYKGEGEGGREVALYSDVKSLSVFVSKYNYK